MKILNLSIYICIPIKTFNKRNITRTFQNVNKRDKNTFIAILVAFVCLKLNYIRIKVIRKNFRFSIHHTKFNIPFLVHIDKAFSIMKFEQDYVLIKTHKASCAMQHISHQMVRNYIRSTSFIETFVYSYETAIKSFCFIYLDINTIYIHKIDVIQEKSREL